jgi:hypothetical protein
MSEYFNEYRISFSIGTLRYHLDLNGDTIYFDSGCLDAPRVLLSGSMVESVIMTGAGTFERYAQQGICDREYAVSTGDCTVSTGDCTVSTGD